MVGDKGSDKKGTGQLLTASSRHSCPLLLSSLHFGLLMACEGTCKENYDEVNSPFLTQ